MTRKTLGEMLTDPSTHNRPDALRHPVLMWRMGTRLATEGSGVQSHLGAFQKRLPRPLLPSGVRSARRRVAPAWEADLQFEHPILARPGQIGQPRPHQGQEDERCRLDHG